VKYCRTPREKKSCFHFENGKKEERRGLKAKHAILETALAKTKKEVQILLSGSD
jgi:hypothetical protein